jgi:hypothetical protein
MQRRTASRPEGKERAVAISAGREDGEMNIGATHKKA